MTLRRRLPEPAFEAATDAGAIVLRDGVAVQSPLEQLLAKGRLRATLAMLGPAFVASIAYVDPGNFATNLQGGAKYGYLLLWVVLLANLIAMLIQYLSAKLGVVTGHSLPENIRGHWSRPVSWGMWIQAEIMAMSTDIAEFLGAALGLNLLFGVPMLVAGLITGVIAFAILELQSRGFRRFELAITALLAIIFLGFLYETLRIGPSSHQALHGLLPGLDGSGSVYLAVGIIGATVMPHVIYLHSALTQGRMPVRNDQERARVLRFERVDVIIALALAGIVNMAMLAVAAKLFHTPGLSGLTTIPAAHAEFGRLVGGGAALAFAVALLASGASSSSVGTYAGQIVMAGFINVRIPVMVRRALTMIPALIVLAAGMNPTDALVLSQVVLSFGIPLALVPLVILTCRRSVMGVHVNRPLTTVLAWGCAILITGLNLFLLYQQLFMG
ncbi:MAG TPA: Nramp family divalent metal transporter [Solirubrobacteraceae bacterium]|jgi:manganese transport protein|nr:Nramp family divalent metal transporter [Solirubrobacteraceae bacterium]